VQKYNFLDEMNMLLHTMIFMGDLEGVIRVYSKSSGCSKEQALYWGLTPWPPLACRRRWPV